MSRYEARLQDLVEGRTDPEAWLAWWDEHEQEVRQLCSPGVFLRLKPGHRSDDPNRSALSSQQAACHVLDRLGVAYQRSDRYQVAADEAFARFVREQEAAERARAQRFKPVIAGLAGHFPRFARFLRSNLEQVDECEPGIDEPAIAELEQAAGSRFPDDYRAFLRCCRELTIGDTLQLTAIHPFAHPFRARSVAIAEYWLEADGDQALLDGEGVFYYAHSVPAVRPLAKTFTAWLETLPRTL